MQQYFHDLAGFLDTCLRGSEQYKCWFEAEDSDFVRFNRSAVRQPGHVRQSVLTVNLMNGLRHAAGTLTLGGEIDYDRLAVEPAACAARPSAGRPAPAVLHQGLFHGTCAAFAPAGKQPDGR